MSFTWRIGQFLLFLGLLALIIFYITLQAESPIFPYCCSGVLLVIFGAVAMWRGRNPPEPSGRFSLLRRRRKRR